MDNRISKEIVTLVRRYERKVDSLNWQSISYQANARKTMLAGLEQLLIKARLDELEKVYKVMLDDSYGVADYIKLERIKELTKQLGE